MKLFAIGLLLFGINSPLQAAIDAAYDGNNGIRNNVLSVCLQCHSSTLTGAARNSAPSSVDFNTYAGASLWGDREVIRAAIEASMPPSGVVPLNQEQKAALLAWEAAGFPEKSAATNTNLKSDCLFDWAETHFADFFTPRGFQSQSFAPYYLRFYSQTTSYLAVSSNDSHLYYLGPVSGNTILDLGAAATWYATSGCA